MEQLETLNDRLERFYGHFEDGRPNFRIVWSEDEYDTVFGTYDIFEKGIYLRTETGFKKIHKYWYMRDQYIVERLMGVPVVNTKDLLVKASYEPIWGFRLPKSHIPPWEAIKLVVDTLINTMHKARSMVEKYKEDPINLNTKEAIEARVEKAKEEIFGGESDTASMALHRKEGVVVPHTFGDS
jgi:hypothetical protein